MDEGLSFRRRVIVLLASLVAVSLAFRFGSRALNDFDGLLSAVPIALAAWFFGARVALAIAVFEAIANAGLIGQPGATASGEEIVVHSIEGAVLSVIAILAAAAVAGKRRLAKALATDPVTGLANRQAFIREVDRLLALGTNVTLGLLDVIDIGAVNETFGFEIGDELLCRIAGRLRDTFGPSAFAAKGDSTRFAVAWPALDQSDEFVALKLLAIVEEPFVVSGAELRPQVRASVTRRDTVGARRASEMTHAAMKSLDRAEREGLPWRSADPAEPTAGVSRLELLSALSRAIANDELRLHYQPIVDLTTGSIQGFEALVRWQHPTRGLVPPLEFIPVAEQSGLIVPLTEWVLDEALRQSRAWSDQAVRIRVSVNVGAQTLGASAALAATVERLLGKHGVEPADLCLEITESDVMTDPAHAATVLGQLKALGVRVEIDDFGTGYSSLAYLQKLPVDGIKIDRSFVTLLLHQDHTSAIVRAAIQLSHALGLDAVAEGVEDDAALQLLKDMGCDAAQGYLIARPMLGAEVLSWAAQFKTLPRVINAPPAATASTAESQGTVLVVDDEHPFRLAAHRILSAQGYRVLHAATASEALRICAEEKGHVSLLLTDIHLSDWRGKDLADHLQRIYPGMRTMFMSGDAMARKSAGTDIFLAKPFSNHELVAGVAGAYAA
jgi:EAL domain-containing protein (putative c-di-GMP-specific phosphodiesterase class I)/GGDEF domain-containing protein